MTPSPRRRDRALGGTKYTTDPLLYKNIFLRDNSDNNETQRRTKQKKDRIMGSIFFERWQRAHAWATFQICNQPLTCKKTTKKLQKHLLFTEAMSDIPEGLTVHYWGGVKSRAQSIHVSLPRYEPDKKNTYFFLTDELTRS